jgi:hypothetical protein
VAVVQGKEIPGKVGLVHQDDQGAVRGNGRRLHESVAADDSLDPAPDTGHRREVHRPAILELEVEAASVGGEAGVPRVAVEPL